jgi:hypothetical protein
MALAGYNPTVSLLPNGGGTIHAMSGGGVGVPPTPDYNASQSLIQNASGHIGAYRGGADENSSVAVPTSPPVPTIPASDAATDISNIGLIINNNPVSVSSTSKPLNITPLAPHASLAVPNASLSTVPSGASIVPPVTPNESVVPVSITPNVIQTQENSNVLHNNKLSKDTKEIKFFGKTMRMEDPSLLRKNEKKSITKNQIEVLTLFGLEGKGVTRQEKIEILEALYAGEACDTEKPLILLEQCEPIRRIVQSLALNLLDRLGPLGEQKNKVNSLKKVDKPLVSVEKSNDGTTKVCLSFKPDQLPSLSAEEAKEEAKEEVKEEAKEEVKEGK